MSGRVFQGVVVQMREATERTVGVFDCTGAIIACSDLTLIGTPMRDMPDEEQITGSNITVSGGRTFRALEGQDVRPEHGVFVEGEDELARSVCVMACIAMTEAKLYYEEKFDKASLIKNIIMDNILPGNVYVHAKELHFATNVPRGVLLVRQRERTEKDAVALLHELFPDRNKDFAFSVSETDIVVVKELPPDAGVKELHDVAAAIQSALAEELKIEVVIGIGTIAAHLREIADRYKEALVALDVGKAFNTELTIINYGNLGIGRLIYQLPPTLCEMFLSEVFKKNSIDSLDEETLAIINKFFENNLNISETSRRLFVHRNTLVYRLGKIKKTTGLDLREFDQAIVFKVALMVKQYLDSQKRL